MIALMPALMPRWPCGIATGKHPLDDAKSFAAWLGVLLFLDVGGAVPGRALASVAQSPSRPGINDPRILKEFEWGRIAALMVDFAASQYRGLLMTQRQMAFWHPVLV